MQGEGVGDPVAVAAHLDTVFPEGTPVTVRKEGDRILGPGISDNGRGLAALLAMVRCLAREDISLSRPLLLAGTVGEEGVGNLRGVRHLFSESGAAHRACAFISLDGAGNQRVVNRSVGSCRVRIRLTGPGGHSWVDWGTPNPVHTLGTTITALTTLPLQPGATLSVGRVSGGISVNAIPEEAWMEMEVRSVDEAALETLEARIRATVVDEVERANDRRREGTPPMALHWQSMGKRPAGTTSPSTPLVQAASLATRELSGGVELVSSSTDANVPMHLGIPSITLGAGGEAGQAHTIEEWYRNVRGPEGIARALLTLLVLDRLMPR
jgi:acetylornithine deacetylase/succinyl-diaminopimelate desuccinylase-like protein